MANTQGVARSFLTEVLRGYHALGPSVVRAATTTDVIKAALYLTTATIGPTTTAYTTTGEVAGAGYTAGGIIVPNANPPATDVASAVWTPSTNLVFSDVTLATAFNCVLLYNSTQGNRAIAAYVFSPQTITGGTLTLTVPSNVAGAALLEFVGS